MTLPHSQTPTPPHSCAGVGNLVKQITDDLTRAAIPEARLKAELVIAEVLGIDRLRLSSVAEIPAAASEAIFAAANRLRTGEPIQYVLGWTSFLGHRIRCDKRALIPRPETEELVEAVLGSIGKPPLDPRRGRDTAPYQIGDIGTGTGCIAIALKLALPGAEVIATDTSVDALNLALENAAALGARVSFIKTDLVEGIADGSLDVLVSNPPYVGADEMPNLERAVRDFEPRSALDGGFQGLELLRPLISKGWKKLKPGGRLFLEIGDAQGQAVSELLREAGYVKIEIRKDFAGHDRIATAMKPEMSPRIDANGREFRSS